MEQLIGKLMWVGDMGKNVTEDEWDDFLAELLQNQIPSAMDEMFMRAKLKVRSQITNVYMNKIIYFENSKQ